MIVVAFVSEKATALRNLLLRPQVTTFVGAHNGLTALAVEREGFDAVWAGSLELSAAHGLADEELLTTTEVLAAVAQINEATRLPVLVDFDTGRGYAGTLLRAVRLFEQAGIAGVCIEDKLFPKRNSFAKGEQLLAPVEEFADRIASAVEHRRGVDFSIVARIEALVVGRGVDEALHRAQRYVDAGADALLLHSKISDAKDIREFMQRWSGTVPVLVVPTGYPDVLTAELQRWGFKGIIYANVVLRTIIAALKENLGMLRHADCLGRLTPHLADFHTALDFHRGVGTPPQDNHGS